MEDEFWRSKTRLFTPKFPFFPGKTPIGDEKTQEYMKSGLFKEIISVPCSDPEGFRQDECIAYAKYLYERYDSYPDHLMLMQSDPQDHLYWDYLNLVLESVAAGTSKQIPVIPLNNGKDEETDSGDSAE